MAGPFSALRLKLPKRTPKKRMVILLSQTDYITADYPKQWPTVFKAERLGYIKLSGTLYRITEKGRKWLIKHV